MLEEISFPSALKNKTDVAKLAITEVATFLQTLTLTAISTSSDSSLSGGSLHERLRRFARDTHQVPENRGSYRGIHCHYSRGNDDQFETR
jgi:hypothetical protein